MIDTGQPHPVLTIPDEHGVMRSFNMGEHYVTLNLTSNIYDQIEYNEINVFTRHDVPVFKLHNGANQCARLIEALRLIAAHLSEKANDYAQDPD